MKKTTVQCKIGQNEITFETGMMAKQADGAIVARCGNNIVLATVVSSKQASQVDFSSINSRISGKTLCFWKNPWRLF